MLYVRFSACMLSALSLSLEFFAANLPSELIQKKEGTGGEREYFTFFPSFPVFCSYVNGLGVGGEGRRTLISPSLCLVGKRKPRSFQVSSSEMLCVLLVWCVCVYVRTPLERDKKK